MLRTLLAWARPDVHARVRRIVDRRLSSVSCTSIDNALMREHIDHCDVCREYYNRRVVLIRTVSGGLATQATGLESRRLFEEVMGKVDRPSSRPEPRRAWFPLAAAATLSAMAVIAIVATPPDNAEYYGVRGGVDVLPSVGIGLSGIDADGNEYEVVESGEICVTEYLRFYVTARDSQLKYYFIFGINNGVFVPYFPLPEEQESFVFDGRSSVAHMVPWEIRLDQRHSAGTLDVVGVLSDVPLQYDLVSRAVDWWLLDSESPDALGEILEAESGAVVDVAWAGTNLVDCGRDQ